MHRQRLDDTTCHGLESPNWKSCINPGLKDLATIDYCTDVRDGSEGGVFAECVPVSIVSDKTWFCFWQCLIQPSTHCDRETLEDLPLLNDRNPLERVNVI